MLLLVAPKVLRLPSDDERLSLPVAVVVFALLILLLFVVDVDVDADTTDVEPVSLFVVLDVVVCGGSGGGTASSPSAPLMCGGSLL